MEPDCRDPATMKKRDAVGQRDGRGAVDDHEGRDTVQDTGQRLFDQRFGVHVKGG
jgi:hypothetical protein